MSKHLIMLDASALSNSGCTYKLWMQTVHGYREKLPSINIEAGTAFHKFRNIYREEGPASVGKACVAARKHLMEAEYAPTSKFNAYLSDPTYMMRVCSEYAIKYENDNLKPLHLEMRFCFPYYVDDVIEVLIAGTIDEIGEIHDGVFCIADCKTTQSANAKDKLSSYLLSNQMLFYHWVLREYGREFPDTEIGRICGGDICIMIDGVFFRGKEKVEFERSEYWIPPKQLTDDYNSTVRAKLDMLCKEFSSRIASGTVPAKDGIIHGICTMYNKCPFFYHCSAVDSSVGEVMLHRYLKQQPYNPLEHQA